MLNIISNLVPLQLNIFVHKHELQASLNNTVGFGSVFPTQCLRFFFFFFFLETSAWCTVHGTWTVHQGIWTVKKEWTMFFHTFKNYFTTVFSVLSKISCIQTDPTYKLFYKLSTNWLEMIPPKQFRRKLCPYFNISNKKQILGSIVFVVKLWIIIFLLLYFYFFKIF